MFPEILLHLQIHSVHPGLSLVDITNVLPPEIPVACDACGGLVIALQAHGKSFIPVSFIMYGFEFLFDLK